MTTATEGRAPTALDLLFDPDTDAAEALASEILSPGGDQNVGRALARSYGWFGCRDRRWPALSRRAGRRVLTTCAR
jgi:hypothetical protein